MAVRSLSEFLPLLSGHSCSGCGEIGPERLLQCRLQLHHHGYGARSAWGRDFKEQSRGRSRLGNMIGFRVYRCRCMEAVMDVGVGMPLD